MRDLASDRQAIKRWLVQHAPVSVDCLLSEQPDFPVTPNLQLLDPYAICLETLASSDYVVQILKEAYGAPDIEHMGARISITHMEYRKAFELRKPVFSLVHQPLWGLWTRRDSEGARKAGIDPALFALLDEMNDHKRRKWITSIRDITDGQQALEQGLFKFDDSKLDCDLGVADGSIVRVESVFDKGWCLENSGMVIWEERFLKEICRTDTLSGVDSRVPIPRTCPGERIQVWVKLKAGKYPATNVKSTWKMVDRNERVCFPHMRGVFCNISIAY